MVWARLRVATRDNECSSCIDDVSITGDDKKQYDDTISADHAVWDDLAGHDAGSHGVAVDHCCVEHARADAASSILCDV